MEEEYDSRRNTFPEGADKCLLGYMSGQHGVVEKQQIGELVLCWVNMRMHAPAHIVIFLKFLSSEVGGGEGLACINMVLNTGVTNYGHNS